MHASMCLEHGGPGRTPCDASVLESEEERLSGQPAMSISEARIALDKRIDILRLKGLQK